MVAYPRLIADAPGQSLERLNRAYRLMGQMVRLLWPSHTPSSDPQAVTWAGAILSLAEEDIALTVVWRDEDHLELFAPVAELAWCTACDAQLPVVHRNADPDGVPLRQPEFRL